MLIKQIFFDFRIIGRREIEKLETNMKRILIAFTMFVAALQNAQPQSNLPAVQLANTERHVFAGTAVADTFYIEVALPANYAGTSRSFPVMYLLDSDMSFGMARDIVNWLDWADEIPAIIVVGISYGGTTDTWWDKRSRDYTPTRVYSGPWGSWPYSGGAAAFKTFLKDELFPFIEKTYRTIPDDRTIVGLSFGGLFAAYVLFTDSAMFHRYITVSPALLWDDRIIFDYEAAFFEQRKVLTAQVFTAVGLKDASNVIPSWNDFNSVLASRKYDGLNWVQHTFSDETHISVFPAALSHGLKSIYSNERSTPVKSTRPAQIPEIVALYQNHPNPFNPMTTIRYEIPRSGVVSLKVYDVLGREVKTLVNEVKRIGRYEVRFDASGLASGVYFYRLQADSYTSVKKMLVLR